MTKADVKSTTQNVVVPGSVVIASLSALVVVLQSFGAVPTVADRGVGALDALKERMAQYEARQVELDRQYREDRANMMTLLIELRGDVKRIEGKLEK